MHASFLSCGSLVLALAALTSPLQSQVVEAPPAVLSSLKLERATIQRLQLPTSLPHSFRMSVVLGKRTYRLSVQKHCIRAAGFKLLVDDGKGPRQVAAPALCTYQGSVLGLPKSRVALTLFEGQVSAYIHLGVHDWWIQPVTDGIPSAPKDQHAVYHLQDAIFPKNFCGSKVRSPAPVPTPASALQAAEIALDCDYRYYQQNGSSVSKTQAAATQIMNATDVIYRRDVEICYTITAILVRTSAVYTSGPTVGCCTNDCGLLKEMRGRWGANHRNIKRDLAHMFTGWGNFSGVIGCAGPPVCGLTGFGVSRTKGSLAANTGLVAHEIGHQWTAGHCSGNSCWIMCSGLGGCGGTALRFGTASQNAIKSYKATRSCLGRCGGCRNEASYTYFGTGCAGSGAGGKDNCVNLNWNSTVSNLAVGNEYAILANSGSSAKQIKSVDFYINAASMHNLPVRIYAQGSGGPGRLLGTATMRVGTSTATYRATFTNAIAIPANTTFYVGFAPPSNFTPFVRAPLATRGSLSDAWFKSGGRFYKSSTRRYWSFRVNCFGTGATPQIAATGVPSVNGRLQVGVTGARASSLAVLFYSLGTANVDLSGAGARGCRLYVSGPFLVDGAVTNGAGTASFATLPIPNDTKLCGASFYQQVFINDPVTNSLKWVATRRGQPVIGN